MVHLFEFRKRYIALDVESGAVHVMDKQAFDVLRAVSIKNDPFALGYPRGEVEEIISELKELVSAGEYETPAPEIIAGTDNSGLIKAMCLHIAHDCNLRCKYCFASTGDFHGERMFMTEEAGRAAIDFLIARSGNRHNLEVDLFGGEPLMNMKVVKSIVSYGREQEKKHGKRINFTITTNGLALNDGLIDYINEEMHNVVISIDGRKSVHDALRPRIDGAGSYDEIAENAQKLIKKRGAKEHYVRGTFTSNNLDFVKDVQALLELGFRQISIEPVVLDETSPYALREEHLARICEEYDRLSELLLDSRREGRWFNFFHFMVDLDGGPCLKKRVSGCGAGSEYVAVTPDGDIYPCHQFVNVKRYLMGSVMDNTLNREIQQEFESCNITSKEKCKSCWAKYFCSGGCAANAYNYNSSIYEPHNLTCELLKKRTECAIGINILEREDDAAV